MLSLVIHVTSATSVIFSGHGDMMMYNGRGEEEGIRAALNS